MGSNCGVTLFIDSTSPFNDQSWQYVPPSARNGSDESAYSPNIENVDNKGILTISIDLTGNKVLIQRTAVAGSYSYQYRPVEVGKHTFDFFVDQAACPKAPPGGFSCNAIIEHIGPTLLLNIK